MSLVRTSSQLVITMFRVCTHTCIVHLTSMTSPWLSITTFYRIHDLNSYSRIDGSWSSFSRVLSLWSGQISRTFPGIFHQGLSLVYSRTFPGKLYSRTFPGIFQYFSWYIPGLFLVYSRTFPGIFQDFFWYIPGLFQVYSRTFPGIFQDFAWYIPGLCLVYSRTFPGVFQDFFRYFPGLWALQGLGTIHWKNVVTPPSQTHKNPLLYYCR